MKCFKCNRPLKATPKNRERGMGPKCWDDYQELIKEARKDPIITVNAEQWEDIPVLGTPDKVSLKQQSQLAFNILSVYLPEQRAMELHIDFREKFIKPIDSKIGATISYINIVEYINYNTKGLF